MSKDIVLTPEAKKAIADAYDEWADQQANIDVSKECQGDIVDEVCEKFDLKKSDVNWVFKNRMGNKVDEQIDKFEVKRFLFDAVFQNNTVVGDDESE